jgi:hypothetical protein
VLKYELILVKTIGRKERQPHFVPTSKNKVRGHRFNKYPIVVRRVITLKGVLDRTEVDIRSPKLGDILIEILDGVPGLGLTKDPPTVSFKLPALRAN